MTTIASRWLDMREVIAAACARSGRSSDEVKVVAVTKKHPAEVVAAVAAAGVLDVGENYAQEMLAKMEAVADPGVRWHFIGRLQRNKAKFVVGHATLIHAVDSQKLLEEIDRRARAQGLVQSVLLAVNVAGEASKGGISRGDAAALVAMASELEGVRCVGLMTMPPLAQAPDDNREHFAALRRLRDELAGISPELRELSMGTSADFEVAVEEGATLVRVGTALVGARPPGDVA